ncbi:MAG: hypothetical protein EOO06_15035 [Chitinophagaceae bacterium]|nr:MAG: hypothetical protein EOO06_15035 [Chitinophagaceae bacterium]
MQIELHDAQSYSYNLSSGTMTIHFNDKPDSIVKFTLTESESRKIIDKYHSLNLDEIKNKEEIQDSCFMMPTMPITVKVISKLNRQEFNYSEGCGSTTKVKKRKAEHAHEFIVFINRILNSKAEIQINKISDIFYL